MVKRSRRSDWGWECSNALIEMCDNDPYVAIAYAVVRRAVIDARALAEFHLHPAIMGDIMVARGLRFKDITNITHDDMRKLLEQLCDELLEFFNSQFFELCMATMSRNDGSHGARLIREEVTRCVGLARRRMKKDKYIDVLVEKLKAKTNGKYKKEVEK